MDLIIKEPFYFSMDLIDFEEKFPSWKIALHFEDHKYGSNFKWNYEAWFSRKELQDFSKNINNIFKEKSNYLNKNEEYSLPDIDRKFLFKISKLEKELNTCSICIKYDFLFQENYNSCFLFEYVVDDDSMERVRNCFGKLLI